MAASRMCMVCGSMGMNAGGDGFFYCVACGSQSQTLQEQDLDDFEEFKIFHVRETNVSRKLEHEATLAFQQSQRAADSQPPTASAFASQAEQDALIRIMSQTAADVSAAEEELRNRIAAASQYGAAAGVQFWSASQTDEPDALLERLGNQFKRTYVKGVQRILQLQCEALVERFGVSPLICGIVGPLWLRFLASTHVFEKEWANEAIQIAEAKGITRKGKSDDSDQDVQNHNRVNKSDSQSDQKRFFRKKGFKEPLTSNGLRVTTVWLASIKERIPLTVTLAISFLACHIAREPILPTDITKWAFEGTLPYLAAFLRVDVKADDLQNYPPLHLLLPNLDAKKMFKPMRMISARMVEFLAAHIAARVSLELPPVNFFALSCRFLKELDLPVNKLISYVCRLYEWYTPSSLWLEAREDAFPSRVYVMAMLFVTLKILFRLDGRKTGGKSGNCQHKELPKEEEDLRSFIFDSSSGSPSSKGLTRNENSLYKEKNRSMSDQGISGKTFEDGEWNAKELVENLGRALFRSHAQSFEYQKDLPTYLRYCKDIIFSGANLSPEEEHAYDHFWELFEKMLKEANSMTSSSESQEQEKVENADPDSCGESEYLGVSSTLLSYSDKKEMAAVKTTGKKKGKSSEELFLGKVMETESPKEDKHESFCHAKTLVKEKHESLLCGKTLEAESMKEDKHESLLCGKTLERGSIKEDKHGSLVSPSCLGDQFIDKRMEEKLFEEMERSGFHCLPPFLGSPQPGRYLIYVHKRKEGGFDRFVHGDYFVVLFACAKIVDVDPKALHRCIRQLEKQLTGIESRINSLKRDINTCLAFEKKMAAKVEQ